MGVQSILTKQRPIILSQFLDFIITGRESTLSSQDHDETSRICISLLKIGEDGNGLNRSSIAIAKALWYTSFDYQHDFFEWLRQMNQTITIIFT